MTGLPSSWTLCAIGDVLQPVEKTSKDEADRPIWYVDISSIDNESNQITTPKRLSLADAPSRARQKIRSGDVLFSTVRPYLRNIAPVGQALDGEIASTGFAVLRGAKGVEPRYLFYKSISHDFISALTGEQYGVSYPAVKEDQVKAQRLELPPTEEQRRIVDRIEPLFDDINRGVKSLRDAKKAVEHYRQSVLQAAFEGRLTASWRAKNPDKLEGENALLARIRKDRKSAYERGLANWRSAIAIWKEDRKGKKPVKPKRPLELSALPASDQLPSGWVALSLESLGRIQTGATPSKQDEANFGGEIPFFKPTDLDAGDDVRVSREYLSESGSVASRRFSAGSVLVTCIGATIGKAGLATVDASCNQQINFLEPGGGINSKFMYFQVIAPYFQGQIKRNASSTTLPILNKGKFSQLPASICSPAEQSEIVRILSNRLEAAESLNAEIEASLARAEVLRQSILKKAFTGQLVPQDPNDEPAASLLQRIRAENTPHKLKGATRRRRKPRGAESGERHAGR